MGVGLSAIIEECEAGDIPLPDEILDHFDRKEPWMDFYLMAYDDLDTCRGSSGRIPWLAMDRYAERYGFDDDFALWFIRCIRAVDDVCVEVGKEQQARSSSDGLGGM